MNGIAISATQPSATGVRAPFQIVSHSSQLVGVVELELVGAPARRPHLEIVGVAPRQAGIERDPDGVAGEQRPVALHRAGDDLLGLAVIGVEPK